MKSDVFQPDALMRSCALNVFFCMAQVELVRQKVFGYKTKILASKVWPTTPSAVRMVGSTITSPEMDFLIDHAHLEEYFQLCRIERAAVKLHANDYLGCPLSEAEHSLEESKNTFVRVMLGALPINIDALLDAPIALRDQFVEESLKLMAPYVNFVDALFN